MALTWTRNGDTMEATFEGRLRFTVQKEGKIWTMWRWRYLPGGSDRPDGAVFQAKERVKSEAEGIAYANGLHERAYGPERDAQEKAKIELLDQWDRLHGAIQSMLCANVENMTARAAKLEQERQAMVKVIMTAGRKA